ncbi:LOW QUALITY PROTEIN: hypothetical protein HID58_006637 [Brassica napus]|uniref:Uncharacterized protein n=1 Tax=Brassica napus TaxID=3708 RepID=A0ABQ8EC21_BRANA|nr:LOW QUALITY PROTEIN: hypothetical protein HID58_006637 [Brassica napus]
MAKVQRALPLGKWGVIENVQMNPAGGKYRTTRHPYKMAISNETVIKGSDLADDRIFLSLSNYESIGKTDTKEAVYLIDVIGRVHDLGDVLTVKAQGEDRKRVEFRLVDSQGNDLPCCLWGTYAEQIEAFIEKSDDRTFVCLIWFAKVTFFRGDVQITNAFDASRMYLNPTEPDVLELTESLSAANSQLATVEKSTGKKDGKRIQFDWNDAEIKPISEIMDATQVQTPCGRERCHKDILMLLGSVAKSIVGVKADDLWDGSYGEIEDPEILPEPIRNLVGKSFCFGVSINSENVSSGSATFLVLEVCSGDKVLSIESGSEAISEMGTTFSTMSSGGVVLLDSSSSEDPKTPYSKRKEDDADLPDLTSTSKKLCTKHSHAHCIPNMMNRKRGNVRLGIDTAKRKRSPTINEIPNLEDNHRCSKSISNQDIPLSSIYFRLLETIEGHQVLSYTIPPFQQISMLSPQTPRNLRRLVLEDLHKRSFKSIKSKGGHKRKSDCNVLKDITNISQVPNKRTPKHARTFNASTQTIEEDDELVGNDLFGGIVDEDNDQVFECSSQENTDTEDEDSDLDDPIVSEEQDDRMIITNKAPNSERVVESVKASKPSKSYVNENDFRPS